MMKCLSESWIELLAIEHLRDKQAVLPAHLKTCTFCRENYESMLQFYQLVIADLAESSPEGMVYDPLEVLHTRSSHTIYLSTMTSNKLESVHKQIPLAPVLAADSEVPQRQSSSVRNRGVLASTDGRLMVRLLQTASGSISCYLLSDEVELYQHVLVSMMGLEQEQLTDEKGFVDLGIVDLPDPNDLRIEVRTPVSRINLQTLFGDMEKLKGKRDFQVSDEQAREISLQILPADSGYSLKVSLPEKGTTFGNPVKVAAIGKDDTLTVQASVNGVAVFSDLEDPMELQLYIYE